MRSASNYDCETEYATQLNDGIQYHSQFSKYDNDLSETNRQQGMQSTETKKRKIDQVDSSSSTDNQRSKAPPQNKKPNEYYDDDHWNEFLESLQ